MSKLLELLQARVASKARPETRIKIYLDPQAASRLVELETELAQLRQDAIESGKPTKMNGRIGALTSQIEEAQAHLLDSTAYVVLRALSPTGAAWAAKDITPDSIMSDLWRKNLAQAFVRVEDLDGNPVEDVTRDHWRELLDVVGNVALKDMHDRLEAVALAEIPS